jgi:molybdopterin-guanine dinucleotide biosynthesis protein MobB
VLAAVKWIAREARGSVFLASVAADVPFVPPDLVQRLAATLATHPSAGVAVARSRGRRHHVIGLWRRETESEIAAALARGERKVEAMVDRLGAVAVPFADIEIGGRNVDPFFNINTPEDLAFAAEVLARGPVTVGIAGWKNSGKTTLVTKLITTLTARGYRVATVKHSHHDLAPDEEGTDSARHRAAGAVEVAVVSPRQWRIGRTIHDEPEPALADVLARLGAADVVLVEGYKHASIPKIEMRRRGQGAGPPLAETDKRVFAIAADHAVENTPVPVFDHDDVEGLADALLASAGLRARNDSP